MLLTLLGEKLNVDIYLAAIVVFVWRMFTNLAIIRRHYIDKLINIGSKTASYASIGAMIAGPIGAAVGGAVGQNIADSMNNMMSGINQPQQTPPPIPTVAYHIAVNGQATGPFDIATLSQMAATGQFREESLVWKQGMAEWRKAGTIEELSKLFADAMPPIPNEE